MADTQRTRDEQITTDDRAAKRAGAERFWKAHRTTWESNGGTEMATVERELEPVT